jgi:Protein of unknown function (DUF3592)
MKPATIFTLARIALIGLLIWAFSPHSYNYYIILRWIVFIVAAYGAWRSAQEKEYYFVLVHLAAAVIFNPFTPLQFERSTWGIINGLTAFFFFISIFLIDSGPFDKFSESTIGKVIGSSISILFALGFLLLGIWFIWESGERLVDAIKLKNNSQQTVANIIDVEQRTETTEVYGREKYYEAFYVDYTFKSEDGKAFEGTAKLTSEPEGDTISIEYERGNPNNSRAIEDTDSSLAEAVIMTIMMSVVGVLTIIYTFESIKKRIKELREIKSPPVKEGF